MSSARLGSPPSSRPKVGLVAHNIHDRGGMERSFAELVRRTRHEVDFHVVTADLAEDLRGQVEWTRVPAPQRPVPVFFASFYAAASLLVPRLDVDLIHTMGAIYPGRADLITVPFCHQAFGELPDETRQVSGGPARRLNRRWDLAQAIAAEKRSYAPGRAGRFAPCSVGVQAELRRFYPSIPSSVVPNGFTPALFDVSTGPSREEVRREFGYAEEDVVAVFLGGDWQRKGLTFAIDGVAEAVDAGAGSLRLSVVGGGDPAPHRRRAEERGIAPRVRFFGHSATPHLHLRAADIFVFPTAYEAFPLVAIEAAAAGLPIVATAVNGIEELIDDGVNGIVVHRDAASIGAALARLERDPVGRREMGSAASAEAAVYTWDAAARATLDVYHELLGTTP